MLFEHKYVGLTSTHHVLSQCSWNKIRSQGRLVQKVAVKANCSNHWFCLWMYQKDLYEVKCIVKSCGKLWCTPYACHVVLEYIQEMAVLLLSDYFDLSKSCYHDHTRWFRLPPFSPLLRFHMVLPKIHRHQGLCHPSHTYHMSHHCLIRVIGSSSPSCPSSPSRST